MNKLIVEIEVNDSFEIGKCKECDFHRGIDQCDLTYLLTKGSCHLNCFCPLKPPIFEDFKEELRRSELGNKQLLEEFRVVLNERNKYLDTIKWIKEQYDTDFTEDEIKGLEPRDKVIYERLEEIIKIVDVL